jgi:uncharacterized Zn finger protein
MDRGNGKANNGMGDERNAGLYARSWWAGRWLRALSGWLLPEQLTQGRTAAMAGQVMDLEIRVGLVQARVQDADGNMHRVRIEVRTLTDQEWDRVMAAMAGQAKYAAQLLNGEMPNDIEDLFRSVGVSLFPTSRYDLTTQCTCPDPARHCRHTAAVYYRVGEALDQDPFLLFVMRGRTREQIMAELRSSRAQRVAGTTPASMTTPTDSLFEEKSLEGSLDSFWDMGTEVETVHVRVERPEIEMELLKVLGDPNFAESQTLMQKLRRIYRRVSGRAVEVAFGEHEQED